MRLSLFCLLLGVVLVKSEEKVASIADAEIREAIKCSQETINWKKSLKENYFSPYVISAEARHQLPTCSVNQYDDDRLLVLEAATTHLAERYGLSKEETIELSKRLLQSEFGRQATQQCAENRPVTCNFNSKFRTIDGSCNNIQKPNDGRTFTCLNRLLPPDYSDGLQAPRTGFNGPLPEPRILSLNIHRMPSPVSNGNSPCPTIFQMSFGQFIDHDIEFTTQPTTANNTPIQCCPNSSNNHPQCLPIRIPPGDPDLPTTTCMNFVRDAICISCSSVYREQMNTRTSVIDCSQVYDTTDIDSRNLRNFTDGRLLSRIVQNAGEVPMPTLNPDTDQCSRPGAPCFRTGDARANQNLGLTSCHIIFLRFHNYVVQELKRLNPQWNDERLYQEGRRILGACFQSIIYKQYLEIVVGSGVMNKFDLYDKISTTYDSTCSVQLFNSFAAASFRFGHTTVMTGFPCITATGGACPEILLRDSFFNATSFYQGWMESIIRGITVRCQGRYDRLLVDDVTRFLYRRNTTSPALDLASINIHRGREHGLPCYVDYVERAHLFQIRCFEDLYSSSYLLIPKDIVDRLRKDYANVRDIDLWVGLLCEPPLQGAIVGPTAAYLIGHQFRQLKFCDRYFYTHVNQAGSFTDAQKNVIKNVYIEDIMCMVTNMPEIPRNVMLAGSQIIPCSSLPKINLAPWKE